MPEEITDEKLLKRIEMERIYYQNADMEDAIDTIAVELKIKKERIRPLAEKVYADNQGSQDTK